MAAEISGHLYERISFSWRTSLAVECLEIGMGQVLIKPCGLARHSEIAVAGCKFGHILFDFAKSSWLPLSRTNLMT